MSTKSRYPNLTVTERKRLKQQRKLSSRLNALMLPTASSDPIVDVSSDLPDIATVVGVSKGTGKTEVTAKLGAALSWLRRNDLEDAVRATYHDLRGSYGGPGGYSTRGNYKHFNIHDWELLPEVAEQTLASVDDIMLAHSLDEDHPTAAGSIRRDIVLDMCVLTAKERHDALAGVGVGAGVGVEEESWPRFNAVFSFYSAVFGKLLPDGPWVPPSGSDTGSDTGSVPAD